MPERPEQPALDLAHFDAALGAVRERAAALEFWLEPGRFLVAAAVCGHPLPLVLSVIQSDCVVIHVPYRILARDTISSTRAFGT